ncbi:MAG: hypothetical protein ACI9C1_002726 [Candidatus Aldehydirespiratoraceae bacterium]|jgi:hypothetical protein
MLGQPVQIAYAVDDIREAARTWGNLGVGPFFVRDHIAVTAVRVDGSPGGFDHSAAYGQWGDIMVELIAVHTPAPPPLGLHHMAFFVDDFAAAAGELTDRGWPEAIYAETPGGTPFAHFDARHELGHFVEIYERTESMERLYDRVRAASVGWIGEALIREL